MATTYPYDDEYMVYDLKRRQYILTHDGFEYITGINLKNETQISDQEANAFFRECSDDIYEFIYSYSRQQAIPYKRHYIAKDEEIREEFIEVLATQARYASRSSANLLKDMNGINIEKSKSISLDTLRGDRGISQSAKNKLMRMGLLYTGMVYSYSDIEEDGTW